jgi:acyl carrier protein
MADPVLAKVENLLVENLGIPKEKIRPEADLRHDLGLDSFAAVELQFAVEEAFDVEVSDKQMDGVATIADLVEALRERVKE